MEIKNKQGNLNELIYLCLQEDEDAFRHLMEQLRPMTKGIFYDMLAQHRNLEVEEWFVLCDHLLHDVLRRFHLESGKPFQAYYRSALQRMALSLIRAKSRHEAHFAGTLQEDVHTVDFESSFQHRHLQKLSADIHHGVLGSLHLDRVFTEMKNRLSPRDMQAISLLYDGHSKQKVMEEMKIGRKALANLLKKARAIYCQLTEEDL